MLLFELIEKLRIIEEHLGSNIPVHINIDHIDQVELFDIIIERNKDGEYLIILE